MTKTDSTESNVPFMKTLIQTTLVNLFTSYLKEEEVAADSLSAAYDEFVVLLSDALEEDCIKHLRRLNYTKIELSFLKQACDKMEEKKQVQYDVFIGKALALIDMEIQIIKDYLLQNRMMSAPSIDDNLVYTKGKKGLTLTWNGTDNDLIELVAALMAAGVIGTTEGKKVTVTDVIKVFEDAFHIKINALYTKRGKVFDRSTDTTPFIDSLRKSYIQMLEKRLA